MSNIYGPNLYQSIKNEILFRKFTKIEILNDESMLSVGSSEGEFEMMEQVNRLPDTRSWHKQNIFNLTMQYEPCREKTRFLHMRKQRRRSAVQ